MQESSENVAVRLSRAVRLVDRVGRVRAGIDIQQAAVHVGVPASVVSIDLANRRDREDRRRRELFIGGRRSRLTNDSVSHPPW